MLRKEMCNMLCSMGHNMEELEVCSNSELMKICLDKMGHENEMMENQNMSRTEMCMMLCNMGHKIEELEVCSNDELMNMCQDKMNMNMNMNKHMMENQNMSRTEMCMMLCNMGHKIEELEVCSNNELMGMCKDKMNMTMGHKMNMDKEMMENKSWRIIKSWKHFENLDESSNKELKSFQKELKSLERKKMSLTDLQKKQVSPSAHASKTKADLIKVEKEIKDIKSKIKKLEK